MDEVKPHKAENEAVEQIAFADRILLNKKDLITEKELEEVEKRIRRINSFAPIRVTQQSIVDIDFILNIGAFDLGRILQNDPSFLEESTHHVNYMLNINPNLFFQHIFSA